MEKRDRPEEGDVPPHVVMGGPPWGSYVDPDLDYIRGQLGSVGSGALGGRSFTALGGFVEANGEETKEVVAEARRILKERAERPGAEQAQAEPQDDDEAEP